MERQKGGIGLRGPGETQLETDRRLLSLRIKQIQQRLDKVEKQRFQGRSKRKKAEISSVSLVGYTNAGKSTLMNALTGAGVGVEDKLFSTLETRTRQWRLKEWGKVLLSDTVGFIRKLPHHLIECFKSTLDEVREAEVLIHVVDISHPNFEDHMNTVNETLKELGAIDKEMITVFNKIDAYQNLEKEDDEPITLADFEHSWMAKNSNPALFISATKKENLEQFRTLLYDRIKTIHTQRYPFDKLLY